ncbi:MAG: DUF192 domain-containing protein [Deltaproteobacteria bacterium]|nr:DUF192 domain-containing protein [Deltaproteobacteria bacterium]
MRRWYLATALFALMSITSSCGAEPRVIISTREGREAAFQVEVADTPTKRELGLQYRKELAADRGMIFLFPAPSLQSFWMKNTPLPLDMIFIGSDRKIAGIVEQTVPFSLEPRSVGAPSQFVLEINGGLSKRLGIRAGDAVRFEGLPPDSVKE